MRARQAVQSLALGHSRTDGQTDRQAGLESTLSAPSSGTVSRLLAGWYGLQIFSLTVVQNAQTGSTVHPPFLAMVTGSFPGIKQSRREVHHSLPCSIQANNVWSYTSTPPTCLHGVDRQNITFTLYTFQGLSVDS